GKNAEKYNLDLDKIIVSGDSAGGYFGAMLAAITINKDIQKRLGIETDLHFGATILNCGIYDVGQALSAKVPFKLGEKILWDFAHIKKAEFDTYEWKEICAPIDFVTPAFPPSFITYAKKDFFC
ncbi:MAG: hypothetical protein RR338_04385, partial [Clostridia bacterium]